MAFRSMQIAAGANPNGVADHDTAPCSFCDVRRGPAGGAVQVAEEWR